MPLFRFVFLFFPAMVVLLAPILGYSAGWFDFYLGVVVAIQYIAYMVDELS